MSGRGGYMHSSYMVHSIMFSKKSIRNLIYSRKMFIIVYLDQHGGT